jgi:hypothetical protein
VLADNSLIAFGAGKDLEAAARPFIATAWPGERQFTIAVISAYEYAAKVREKFDCYADQFSGGLCPLDPETIRKVIDQTRERYPHAFIVVFPHWGANYEWCSRRQTKLADQIMAVGADLILGHGAHSLQEIKQISSGWVVYGIGNFMFNSPGRYAQKQALPYSFLAKILVRQNQGSLDKSLRLFPILTDNKRSGYQTCFANRAQFSKVIESLEERCPILFRDAKIVQAEDHPFIELAL